jgi:hypothetical protein
MEMTELIAPDLSDRQENIACCEDYKDRGARFAFIRY